MEGLIEQEGGDLDNATPPDITSLKITYLSHLEAVSSLAGHVPACFAA